MLSLTLTRVLCVGTKLQELVKSRDAVRTALQTAQSAAEKVKSQQLKTMTAMSMELKQKVSVHTTCDLCPVTPWPAGLCVMARVHLALLA